MEAVRVSAAPQAKSVRKFYILDRDDTLIDKNNALINPQAIVPFVQGIEEEENFGWAIASSGAVELNEDEGYKALRAARGGVITKPPVYVQFNRQATLLRSTLAIAHVRVEGKDTPVTEEDKAKAAFDILLTAQLEAEAPHPKAREEEDDLFVAKLAGRPIKSLNNDIEVTFEKKSQITFQFGDTKIRFNLKKLLENIGDIAKGDYKLFFIFQALDAAKLKLSQTYLDHFGVEAIETPPDYMKIAAKDVVFLDDKESNCAVMAKAGFTAIVADTAITLDKRENKTTDTYLEKLENTLPPSVRLKRLIASNQNVNFKSRPTEEILTARNQAILFLSQLLNSQEEDPNAVLKELPKLAPLFDFKEIRVFSKSVDPMAVTSDLLALADIYIRTRVYQKEFSDFLILNLSHEWKRADIQMKVREIASIKPEGQADISTTHFREAYQAQYNTEFFKNPFSSMHKEIERDPAAFDQKSMEDIKHSITEKNGRSNRVLATLGAK